MNKLKVNVWKDNNGNNITFANIDTTNNTILINTPANVLVDDYDTPLDKFIDSIPTSENSTISLIFDNSVVAKQCYELSDKHSNKYLRFNIDNNIIDVKYYEARVTNIKRLLIAYLKEVKAYCKVVVFTTDINLLVTEQLGTKLCSGIYTTEIRQRDNQYVIDIIKLY